MSPPLHLKQQALFISVSVDQEFRGSPLAVPSLRSQRLQFSEGLTEHWVCASYRLVLQTMRLLDFLSKWQLASTGLSNVKEPTMTVPWRACSHSLTHPTGCPNQPSLTVEGDKPAYKCLKVGIIWMPS